MRPDETPCTPALPCQECPCVGGPGLLCAECPIQPAGWRACADGTSQPVRVVGDIGPAVHADALAGRDALADRVATLERTVARLDDERGLLWRALSRVTKAQAL